MAPISPVKTAGPVLTQSPMSISVSARKASEDATVTSVSQRQHQQTAKVLSVMFVYTNVRDAQRWPRLLSGTRRKYHTLLELFRKFLLISNLYMHTC